VQARVVHTVAAVKSDTNHHYICGLDIFVYSVFSLFFTYLS